MRIDFLYLACSYYHIAEGETADSMEVSDDVLIDLDSVGKPLGFMNFEKKPSAQSQKPSFTMRPDFKTIGREGHLRCHSE